MKNFKYVCMVLLGGVLYGTMSSFVKIFYKSGYHAAELSFAQAFVSACVLAIFLIITNRKEIKNLNKKDVLSLLATGTVIGLTNFLYYQSVSYIPASLAIVLLMQFTWFSMLMEWIFFGKKPSKIEVITVIFILLGTVLAGNLLAAEAITLSMKGVLLVLASSLTYALYIVANSRVGATVSWQPKSTLIMMGSASMIFAVNAPTIIHTDFMSVEFLLIALFMAIIGSTIPTALFASGIPKVGAGISSILMTVELPVAVLFASIILHEQITWIQMLGIIIMLVAISAMNYYKSQQAKRSIATV